MNEMNEKIIDENYLNNNDNNDNNDNNINNNDNNNNIIKDEEEEEYEKDETYENLLNSRFKQQQLPCWRPKPTLMSSFYTYLSFGLGLIFFGIILFFFKPFEKKIRYDDKCKNFIKKNCTVHFKLPKTLEKGHILVSYELHGFNQNHRKFITSKSEDQLKGKKSTDGCGDLSTNKEMNINNSIIGTPLNKSDDAIPCGLYARNYFNDKFTLYKNNSTEQIIINDKGIAWDNDKDKFKNVKFEDGWENHQWLNMTDEHFIVWMRPSFLNDFRKLWGKIDEKLEEGEYYFEIGNNYNVSDDIKKYVVISKINIFGSENTLMIITSLIIGTFCSGIAIYLRYLSKKKDKKKII